MHNTEVVLCVRLHRRDLVPLANGGGISTQEWTPG